MRVTVHSGVLLACGECSKQSSRLSKSGMRLYTKGGKGHSGGVESKYSSYLRGGEGPLGLGLGLGLGWGLGLG